jgi:hypothetical protein
MQLVDGALSPRQALFALLEQKVMRIAILPSAAQLDSRARIAWDQVLEYAVQLVC